MSNLGRQQFATIIPLHRGTLTIAEERRLRLTLKNSPIDSCFFVGPENLQDSLSHALLQSAPFVGFSDRHFESVRTYSRWMLMPELYQKFNQFKFIVVCQLDAVIVQPLPLDLDFGFDFIGAPWTTPWIVLWNPFTGKFVKNARRPFARTLRVGNGGLSIRRVNVFSKLGKIPRSKKMPNEDVMISYFHRRLGIRLASPELAAHFFMETGARSWTLDKPIPPVFGFHALEKFNPVLEATIFSEVD